MIRKTKAKNKLTTRFKKKKETQTNKEFLTKEAEKVYQRLSLSVNQIHTKKVFLSVDPPSCTTPISIVIDSSLTKEKCKAL